MSAHKMIVHSRQHIRDYLSEHNLRAVAKATGLHENSVYRFMKGETEPKLSTWVRLSDYVDSKQNENIGV